MTALTVLHCIPTMGGGGAERQLTYLAAELVRIGWRVHVAVTCRGPNWARLERSGAIVHEVPARNAYDARVWLRLRRIIADVNPNIVQVWLLQMEILGGLSAAAVRKPWIFSERASEAAYAPSFKNRVRTRMARRATAIVSNSEAGDRYWADRVPSRVRRYVIPNGIPLDEIAATPAASGEIAGFAADEPLVLFAGRLDLQKNIDVLLESLGLVMARQPIRAILCGQGPLRPRIDDWIRSRRLDGRVAVLGYAPELWSLMKQANVFVSPSLFEGNPNVVLEAMACKTPLVVSDIPEHRELLDETSAILVPPTSAERLAEGIERALRDPAAAAARARVAFERAGRYTLAVIARRYDSMYREILSGQVS
jgi:glycosyltransferase involved in cell wall biosynthesis